MNCFCKILPEDDENKLYHIQNNDSHANTYDIFILKETASKIICQI